MGSMRCEQRNLQRQIKKTGDKLESLPTSVNELLCLLDEVEGLLTRVDQSPPSSVTIAMKPLMTALSAKELLSHPDDGVRVAVVACISEITRITAPNAPYDDDLMKDLFKRIVESFERLDDLVSSSFSKRISILETMSKLRSCVVMLDLECDDLILEMFQHFLKTVSLNHHKNIFTLIETIMSNVIEESEEVSKDLVLCLLQSVRNNIRERSVSCKLGEKVISNCADKMKPLVMELVGDKTNEYPKFVMSFCQDVLDGMEQSNIEALTNNAPKKSEIAEPSLFDDGSQESYKEVNQEHEAECLRRVVSVAKNTEAVEPLAVVDVKFTNVFNLSHGNNSSLRTSFQEEGEYDAELDTKSETFRLSNLNNFQEAQHEEFRVVLLLPVGPLLTRQFQKCNKIS